MRDDSDQILRTIHLMKRRLQNRYAVLSLIIGVGSLVALLMSYDVSHQFQLMVGEKGPNGGESVFPKTGWEISYREGALTFFQRGTHASWGVEFWQPVLASLMLIFLWSGIPATWHLVRKVERKKGYCAICGYDLRATPERCPECGVVPGKVDS